MPYATTNPATGETEREFPSLTDDQVDSAVRAAHEAYEAWRVRPLKDRAAVIGRVAELMGERREELAQLITREMGKLIGEARGEVGLAASIFKYYAENGAALTADHPYEVKKGEAKVVTRPIGPLIGVMPWNFPYYQVARFAAPNVVLGNTILLKHAGINPQCALALRQLFTDAGAPDGVYTNLFCESDKIERIIDSPLVAGASLTGSEAAGRSVGEIAGRNLKKVVLELGGSDPFVVLDGEHLDATVTAAVAGRMANTGQSCVASKRFIVLGDVYDDFVERFAAELGALSEGDPADESTTLGPLSSAQAVDDLESQVDDALANDSSYGLGGTVIGADVAHAQEVADRIDTGMVWINHPTGTQADLPFGGVKRSGVGRELSDLGINEFVNKKLIRTLPAASDTGQAGG